MHSGSTTLVTCVHNTTWSLSSCWYIATVSHRVLLHCCMRRHVESALRNIPRRLPHRMRGVSAYLAQLLVLCRDCIRMSSSNCCEALTMSRARPALPLCALFRIEHETSPRVSTLLHSIPMSPNTASRCGEIGTFTAAKSFYVLSVGLQRAFGLTTISQRAVKANYRANRHDHTI